MNLKRILVLLSLLVAGSLATYAQNDSIAGNVAVKVDTIELVAVEIDVPDSMIAWDEDEVVNSTDDLQFSSKVRVAGNPLINRLSGLVVNDPQYSRYFLEANVHLGYSEKLDNLGAGFGINAAYIPKRWGAYMDGFCSRFKYSNAMLYRYQVSMGVVVRPVMEPSSVDWQVFLGPSMGGLNWGYELGTRLAVGSLNDTNKFSWISGSLSMIQTLDGTFYTLGLSLELSAIVLLSIL